MKHSLALLVLFVALIAQSCSNEKIENDWTRDNLQGKVLSYSEFSYEAKKRFGNIEKGKRTYYGHNNKYDKNGNVTEQNDYNLDGSLRSKETYKYDENGNETEKNYYNSDGSLKRKYTSKYDEKGYKIERYQYPYSDGRIAGHTTIYKYDKNGNEIECDNCGFDGTAVDYKKTHKYDEKGNKIESKGILDDGSLHFKRSFEYDENGNETERNSYNSDGSLDYKYTSKYEFDKQGNWIKRIEFKDGIPTYILERQYEYYD